MFLHICIKDAPARLVGLCSSRITDVPWFKSHPGTELLFSEMNQIAQKVLHWPGTEFTHFFFNLTTTLFAGAFPRNFASIRAVSHLFCYCCCCRPASYRPLYVPECLIYARFSTSVNVFALPMVPITNGWRREIAPSRLNAVPVSAGSTWVTHRFRIRFQITFKDKFRLRRRFLTPTAIALWRTWGSIQKRSQRVNIHSFYSAFFNKEQHAC